MPEEGVSVLALLKAGHDEPVFRRLAGVSSQDCRPSAAERGLTL